MRLSAAPLFLLACALSSPAAGQTDSGHLLAGAYGVASLTRASNALDPRFGAAVVIPIRGRLELYPELEVTRVLRLSEALLDIRIKPLQTHAPWSFWYVGGGLALSTAPVSPNLLTGAQWPSGPIRPFVELQFFTRNISAVDVHFGLALPVS
jgi:hypothetical protein